MGISFKIKLQVNSLFKELEKEGIYKKDFSPEQMQQIYFGFKKGLLPEQVKLYANPEYSSEQMNEIRYGFEEGLTLEQIKIYAALNSEGKPVFNMCEYDCYDYTVALQMSEIRLGLEAGLDVSLYTILNSEGKPAYSGNQMRQIRWGLEDGLDVSKYINPEFDERKMEQIRKGLKAGLDVSQYANPEYEWSQMEEIRLGLEKGIDVSMYANPRHDWRQMKEIRWGLEQGLIPEQIKIYTALDSKGNLIFDNKQMAQIRKILILGMPEEVVKREIANPEFSPERMEERKEELDKKFYELGREIFLTALHKLKFDRF